MGEHTPPLTLLQTHTYTLTASKETAFNGESASLPLSAHQTMKLAQLVDRDDMRRRLLRTHTHTHTVWRPVTDRQHVDEIHTHVTVT